MTDRAKERVSGGSLPLFALGMLALTGCDLLDETHACTAIGCPPGVSIGFIPPLLESGLYRFDVETDSDELHCEIDFASDQNPTLINECTNLSIAGPTTVAPDASLADNSFAIRGLELWDRTQRVALTVTRDGRLLFRHEFAPVLGEPFQINGPGCGECRTAQERVATE